MSLPHEAGRAPEEPVQDAVAGLVDDLTAVENVLDRRYEDFVSGEVEGIPSLVLAEIRRKSAARRVPDRSF